MRSGKEGDLNQAWELYYHVFRRISRQIPQITTLELQFVSPKLLSARDFELAVPGTYKAGAPVVRIVSFAPTLAVIDSKQKPRKLTINGSDGIEYVFLIKGKLPLLCAYSELFFFSYRTRGLATRRTRHAIVWLSQQFVSK